MLYPAELRGLAGDIVSHHDSPRGETLTGHGRLTQMRLVRQDALHVGHDP